MRENTSEEETKQTYKRHNVCTLSSSVFSIRIYCIMRILTRSQACLLTCIVSTLYDYIFNADPDPKRNSQGSMVQSVRLWVQNFNVLSVAV